MFGTVVEGNWKLQECWKNKKKTITKQKDGGRERKITQKSF